MGRHLAVAADGTVAVTGNFSAPFDPGTGTLQPTGGGDAFIASYTKSGEPRWARAFGGAGRDEGLALAYDGGDLYAVVGFSAPLDLGGGPLPADPQGGLALGRFGAAGALRWAIAFGGSNGSVAAVPGGDVVVAGTFQGSMAIAGKTLASAGDTDVFVARFGGDGKLRWARSFGGSGADHADAVALDASGRVYVGGSFSGTVDPGAGPKLTAKGDADAFVAAFEVDGTPRWAVGFGSPADDEVFGLALKGERIAITGTVTGPAVIAGAPLSAVGPRGYVAALDLDGKGLWAVPFGGGTGFTAGRSLAIADDGALVLGGVLGEGSAFGTEPLGTQGYGSPFVAVLAPADGAPRWARAFPAETFGDVTGVGAADTGHVYLAGWHVGALGGVEPPLAAAGAEDAFLLRLAPP
jgi:hypothetical protein